MLSVWQDIRLAARVLWRRPGFSAVAILTLALGVGANSAIFTIVDAVLLRPLPFPHPEQLVHVAANLTKLNVFGTGISVPELMDYRSRSGLFAEISAVWPISVNLTDVSQPERVEGLITDDNYFAMLGVGAQLGRVYDASDYTTGIGSVAVISDAVWHRLFGGSPDVIGKSIRLDTDLYTIIGVAPRGFIHPGKTVSTDIDVWAPCGWVGPPFAPQSPRRAAFLPEAIARLKSGINLAQSQQRMAVFAASLRQQFPNDYLPREGWEPVIEPLGSNVVRGWRQPLFVLLGTVALVLLIACANIASLTLAHANARRREMAVRRSLGAGIGHLVRQWIIENLLLAMIGGVVGLAIAWFGVPLLVTFAPTNLPHLNGIHVNAAVLFFTLLTCVIAGLLFGLAPAWDAAKTDVLVDLNDASRSSTATGRARQLRKLLVVTEVALAFVLLVCSGLLVESFRNVLRVSPGFDAHNLLTFNLWLPIPNNPQTGPYSTPEKQRDFYRRLLAGISSLPGVEAASGTTLLPLSGSRGFFRFAMEGGDVSSGEVRVAEGATVTADYFHAMHIPIVSGNIFGDNDDPKSPEQIVVSQAFVTKFLPGQNPIGKRIRFGPLSPNPSWATIAGVAGDVRFDGLDLNPRPQVYRSQMRLPGLNWTVVIRSDTTPESLARPVAGVVHSVDPNEPIFELRSMDEVIGRALAQRRFAMWLIGLFAAAALLLSALGVYGVLSYTVGQRTREIGIRLAIGASRGRVLGMVLWDGLGAVAAGLVIGAFTAIAAFRFIESLLFEVRSADPMPFLMAMAVLLAAAGAACWIPARRATRVDPIIALRYE